MRFFKTPANDNESDRDDDAPATRAPQADLAGHLADVVARVQGTIGAAIVSDETGALLATAGSDDFDLATASAGHLEVFRAQRDVLGVLGLESRLEDILITLRTQYHLIRPLAGAPLLLCIVVESSRGNLGLARHHLRSLDAGNPRTPP